MTLEVVIEPFSERDLEPLRELFASYFPPGDRLLTAEYSRWLYDQNPFGAALMVKVLDAQRWVGFMAMIPVTLTRAGEDLAAYYVVNVLVHPDFHGKHLFGRMIKAAKSHIEHSDAALLGNPNNMAMKSWERARMQFHEALEPSLVLPKPWLRTATSRKVSSLDELLPYAPILARISRAAIGWRVAATPEYLEWRYLRHPTNRYIVQALDSKGSPVGIQVAKRMYPSVRLLIDQFVLLEHIRSATALLPPLTVSFWPSSRIAEMTGAVTPLPWKKRMPFFLTRTKFSEESHDVAHLGLSASDL